ncbi:MAG TPA: hypothetical protein VEP90_25430 [Methylomirabilota bacterium]|nr:hypothetical protein [Methylomirabilota bacterium]
MRKYDGDHRDESAAVQEMKERLQTQGINVKNALEKSQKNLRS